MRQTKKQTIQLPLFVANMRKAYEMNKFGFRGIIKPYNEDSNFDMKNYSRQNKTFISRQHTDPGSTIDKSLAQTNQQCLGEIINMEIKEKPKCSNNIKKVAKENINPESMSRDPLKNRFFCVSDSISEEAEFEYERRKIAKRKLSAVSSKNHMEVICNPMMTMNRAGSIARTSELRSPAPEREVNPSFQVNNKLNINHYASTKKLYIETQNRKSIKVIETKITVRNKSHNTHYPKNFGIFSQNNYQIKTINKNSYSHIYKGKLHKNYAHLPIGICSKYTKIYKKNIEKGKINLPPKSALKNKVNSKSESILNSCLTLKFH